MLNSDQRDIFISISIFCKIVNIAAYQYVLSIYRTSLLPHKWFKKHKNAPPSRTVQETHTVDTNQMHYVDHVDSHIVQWAQENWEAMQ